MSRHPATIRRVAQSLGAVGLGVNHALNPGALARAKAGDLQLAVIDLDVDVNASPRFSCLPVVPFSPLLRRPSSINTATPRE